MRRFEFSIAERYRSSWRLGRAARTRLPAACAELASGQRRTSEIASAFARRAGVGQAAITVLGCLPIDPGCLMPPRVASDPIRRVRDHAGHEAKSQNALPGTSTNRSLRAHSQHCSQPVHFPATRRSWGRSSRQSANSMRRSESQTSHRCLFALTYASALRVARAEMDTHSNERCGRGQSRGTPGRAPMPRGRRTCHHQRL